MKLKTYFSVIKELLTCSHCLIYMECAMACCLNCFQRKKSICILNLSLVGCVQLNAVMSHAIMHVPHVQSMFLLSGDACDCKYCCDPMAAAVLSSPSLGSQTGLSCGYCKGIEHSKNKFSLAFSYQKTAYCIGLKGRQA